MPTNDNTSRGRRPDTATLSRALSKGEPREIATIVALGADLHYRRESGYDALLDAVHGRDIVRDGRLMELLQFLVSHKVDLNGMSLHGETALRVLCERLPTLQRDGKARYRYTWHFHALESLPVSW